jgi:hypothetical protein
MIKTKVPFSEVSRSAETSFISRARGAEILGVSTQPVDRLIHRGLHADDGSFQQLRAHRVCGRVVVRRDDLLSPA